MLPTRSTARNWTMYVPAFRNWTLELVNVEPQVVPPFVE